MPWLSSQSWRRTWCRATESAPCGPRTSPWGLIYHASGSGSWTVTGAKPFCSGAALTSFALMTAGGSEASRLFLIDVALAREEGRLTLRDADWFAAGMTRCETRTIDCAEVAATPVGEPGSYVERPGFWHGAMGFAACWSGGTQGVAATMLSAVRARDRGGFALAALGRVTSLLDGNQAALDRAAALVDEEPADQSGRARRTAESLRAGVVAAADEVLSGETWG